MIYYTSSSGQVVGGTAGSDLSGITTIPSNAEYAIYIDDTTVSSLNPSNVAGTYTMTDIVAASVYTVPTAMGTLTFTPTPNATLLADAQASQLVAIQNGLSTTLSNGFTSQSTGHSYVTTTNGQTNMEGDLARFTYDTSLQSVQFYTIDAGWIAHSQAQLQSAFLDGGNWKDAQYAQAQTLSGQVATLAAQSGTTVEQIQAVVWVAATY